MVSPSPSFSQGTGAEASKEANKNVAKDSNASVGTRVSAGMDALGDKLSSQPSSVGSSHHSQLIFVVHLHLQADQHSHEADASLSKVGPSHEYPLRSLFTIPDLCSLFLPNRLQEKAKH